MSEFNDRMSAQRRVLQLVNRKNWGKEELFGLSGKAIDRWILVNSIDPASRPVDLLRSASTQLLCLAAKSQEQVSDDYRKVSHDVEALARAIEVEIG
jgi:hypothetical protein